MDERIAVLTGESQTRMYRLLAMRAALRLEEKGMRHSRGSVTALVKRQFGFAGGNTRVREQFYAYVEGLLDGGVATGGGGPPGA